jgi:hypothetical protein
LCVRNPHILGKLVSVYGIAEHGSAYPPALWNPHAFVASDYFEAIGKTNSFACAQVDNAFSH